MVRDKCILLIIPNRHFCLIFKIERVNLYLCLGSKIDRIRPLPYKEL